MTGCSLIWDTTQSQLGLYSMSIYMSIGIYLGEDFGAEKSNRGVATGVAANDWWRDVHRWCPPSTGGSRAGAHGAGRAADVSAAAAHADPPPNNGLVGVSLSVVRTLLPHPLTPCTWHVRSRCSV